MNRICSSAARALRQAATAAALVVCAGAASAAVTYHYQGPVLYPGGQYYPGYDNGSAPRLVGSATFDDTIVTDSFTGSARAVSSLLGWGFPNAQYNAGTSLFSFVNGQISAWNLAAYIPQTVQHPIRGTVHYNQELRSSPTIGDMEYDPVVGFLYRSLPGVIGTWAIESSPAVVPLPLPLPLLVLGLAGLAASVRRKRAERRGVSLA